MAETMTVKELKEQLADKPDTYDVRFGMGFPLRELTTDHANQKVNIW